MSSLSYKPLRKSVHLTQITDEEIRWKMANRRKAAAYLATARPRPMSYPPWLDETTIVPGARGKIGCILLTLPGYYDQKNPEETIDRYDRSHFTTLLKHLSRASRKYVILCHGPQVEEVHAWFAKLGIEEKDYQLAVSVFNYSIWAQDAYLVLADNNGNSYLAESVCFTRDQDMSVADDLASQTDIGIYQSHLYFQGGNILTTDDYVIVGMDYVRENEGRVRLENEANVLREFSRICNKKTIAAGRNDLILHRDRQYMGGGVYQPIFHLDMYVTPTAIRGKNGKEILFVASPRLAREILGEKENPNDLDIYFDEVAAQLEDHFEIRRMPILPTQFNTRESLFPRHYYLTYNNALVENYAANGKQERHVYLPTFSGGVEGFKKDRYITAYYGDTQRYATLDAGAKQLWQSAGFTVHEMDPLEDLAMSWGSVHCMVKVLGRSDE